MQVKKTKTDIVRSVHVENKSYYDKRKPRIHHRQSQHLQAQTPTQLHAVQAARCAKCLDYNTDELDSYPKQCAVLGEAMSKSKAC
jgi:hypothetical protein